jgi:hypothetical protein
VGGDYYDLWTPDEGRTIVVVADVAGKGLPAALLMPALRIAVRSSAARHREPAQIVEEVNEALCQTTEPSSFATLFFASLDTEDSALTYVNAGHRPGLLVDGGGEVRWLSGGGTPVGLIPKASYESHTLPLAMDDLLVLYTDGVWEAENEAGEEFGRERLARAVLAARDRPAREIVQAVRSEWARFRGGADPADDTTVIALRRALRWGRLLELPARVNRSGPDGRPPGRRRRERAPGDVSCRGQPTARGGWRQCPPSPGGRPLGPGRAALHPPALCGTSDPERTAHARRGPDGRP